MSLAIYKKGQGYYTRMGTALAGAAISALGCWALYQKLEGILNGDPIRQWIRAGVPALILAVLFFVIYKVLNHPGIADFMIATEGEMKKVSWSSRKEIVTSTRVVVVTVIILAVLLGLIDYLFSLFFHTIGVLEVF